MRSPFLFGAAMAAIFWFSSCTKDIADPLPPITDTFYVPGNKVPVAEAGPARLITYPDTVRLRGSGIDSDGTILAYLWSQLAGPGESSIMNPADSMTSVHFSGSGIYKFQLMVVDNSGATGVDTVTVVVSPSAHSDTLISQPSNNPNSVMIWGNLNGLDMSWNLSPETGAAAWTYNSIPIIERSAFKFDLSAIPSTATIVSAQLSLYSEAIPLNGNLTDANFGVNNSMYIKEITNDWDPTTANFAHQPSTSSTNQVLVPSTTESTLDINADVKDIVAHMIASQTNYGFMIQMQTEVYYTSRLFYSSYATDPTKHPKLVVVYK